MLAAGTPSTARAQSGPAGPSSSAAGRLDLDEKVGWYRFDDGSLRLVTWGAEGGLTVNDFDNLEQVHLEPTARDVFTWRREGYEEHVVRFEAGLAASALRWIDARGVEGRAEKVARHLYEQEEVRFRNGTAELVGLLLTPTTAGPHPAVVFIHGAGVGHRDNLWYLYHANYLARRGIAVLLPDKRGCGKSSGDWETASFRDLAADAGAAVDYLRSVDRIDPARIGVIGVGEGGWVAPVAAGVEKGVRFVVNVSGSAVTPNEQIRHAISSSIRRYGTPDFIVPLIAFALERRSKNKSDVWWEKNGDFDPVRYWRDVSVPILVVYGSEDEQDSVPVRRSIARLEQAKQDSGNRDFSVEVFENTGHTMDDPETSRIRGDYLDLLVSWILMRSA